MTLSQDKRSPERGQAEAGQLVGCNIPASAHPLPPEVAEEVMNQMADSIVELTAKLEESEARTAVLEEERKILTKERDIAKNGETIEEWDHWRTAGERDEWRECAEKLAYVIKGQVPWPPSMDETRIAALAEFDRLKETSK